MVKIAILGANPYIAKEYGINEAILLNNIGLWTNPDKDNPNKPTYYNERYWIRISLSEIQELFNCMSMSGIKRCLDKLIKSDLLVKGSFNFDNLDKTLWYALTDKGLDLINSYPYKPIYRVNQETGELW